MAFYILEVDALPRERGALQARINEARYQRKKLWRRRFIFNPLWIGLFVLASQHMRTGPDEALQVAIAMACVLVVTTARLVVQVRRARAQLVVPAVPEVELEAQPALALEAA